MTNIHRLPTDRIAREEDPEILRRKLDDMSDKLNMLKHFTLDLLRRHPEEMLAFELYSNAHRDGRSTEAASRQVATRAARRETSRPVVYYIDRGDRVKIGVSRSIVARMSSLYAVDGDLLAVEPGDAGRENVIHRLFAEDKIERELFRKSDAIMARIADLREKYPDPLAFAKELNGLVA